MAESSPWGTVQHSSSITRGVRVVSTASHGGLMVAPGWAQKHLSQAARDRGMSWYNGTLAYEEDCDCEIVLFEIMTKPELRDVAEAFVAEYFEDGRTVEEEREKLRRSLSYYNADYLEEIGEPVCPEAYRTFLARRLGNFSAHKCPDLLDGPIHAVKDDPDVLVAYTADGRKHLVKKQPPFELTEWGSWTAPDLTFLCQVEVVQEDMDKPQAETVTETIRIRLIGGTS